MFDSEITSSTSISKVNVECRWKKHLPIGTPLKIALSGLVLLTIIIVMIVTKLPFFCKCLLSPMRVLCLDVLPYIWHGAGALLTPPFLFVIFNSTLIAILVPSGLFRPQKSETADVSNVYKKLQADDNDQHPAEVSQPSPSSYLLARSTQHDKASIKCINTAECLQPPRDQPEFQEFDSNLNSSHYTGISLTINSKEAELFEHEAKAASSPISIGHEDGLCHELDDLNERIEAFIANVRKQMRTLQEPYETRLWHSPAFQDCDER